MVGISYGSRTKYALNTKSGGKINAEQKVLWQTAGGQGQRQLSWTTFAWKTLLMNLQMRAFSPIFHQVLSFFLPNYFSFFLSRMFFSIMSYSLALSTTQVCTQNYKAIDKASLRVQRLNSSLAGPVSTIRKQSCLHGAARVHSFSRMSLRCLWNQVVHCVKVEFSFFLETC